MRRLRDFLRDKRHNKDSKQPKKEPPLPSLPPPIADNPDTWTSTGLGQTQGFFALPYDLRHQILKIAFGGRTVHIDLRLRPSLHDFESSGGRDPGHAGYPPLFGQGDNLKPRAQKATWQWFHCICHRDPPWRYLPGEVCKDTCLEGRALCYGGTWKWDACQLGAMGFLLSCKQGHEDLMNVLYSTNIIFIESMPLIEALCTQRNLGNYRLLGRGLDLITSLQLRLDFVLFSDNDTTKEALDRSRLVALLEGLTGTFAKLQTLEITFQEQMYSIDIAPHYNLPAIYEHLLHPFLVLSQQNRPVTISVSVSEPFYEAIVQGFKSRHAYEASTTNQTIGDRWLWYPFADSFGHNPQDSGYWIKAGATGLRYWRDDGTSYLNILTVAHCFGPVDA